MLRGSAVEPLTDADGIARGRRPGASCSSSVRRRAIEPGDGETVVLTLGVTAIRRRAARCSICSRGESHGPGGVLLDSVREFCRKRGIRFAPGPWRYSGGLV